MNNIIHDDWMQTYTGKHFYLMNPTEDMICIEDIAHALSMICRFGGHTLDFYSVAEHSVNVSDIVSNENRLAALLHDASEAYISDIVSPFKPFLNNYKDIEHNIMLVVAKKFGFQYPLVDEVKEADIAQLKQEAVALLKIEPKWVTEERYATPNISSGMHPMCFSPRIAENLFLNVYKELTNEYN